ncbi:hypothetical protein [Clostridium oryzae]|uniref:hypothetical protein n=1 Tax=Clostridium oryzae TaxID=1450648 RepID=UPI0009A4E69A|nr:hypothetical protein [Clostridium oryzae]
MRRKIYSFLIIIYTLLTVLIISCYKPDKVKLPKQDNYKGYSVKPNNKNKPVIIKDKITKRNLEETKTKTKIKTKVKKNKTAIRKNQKKYKKISESKKKYDNMFTTTQKSEEYPDSTAVFKVSIYNIQKEISFADKLKIISIVQGISPQDYSKVYGYLQDEDAVEAIIKTFKLLKKRLSDGQYNKLQQVASKYINMDKLKNYIEK